MTKRGLQCSCSPPCKTFRCRSVHHVGRRSVGWCAGGEGESCTRCWYREELRRLRRTRDALRRRVSEAVARERAASARGHRLFVVVNATLALLREYRLSLRGKTRDAPGVARARTAAWAGLFERLPQLRRVILSAERLHASNLAHSARSRARKTEAYERWDEFVMEHPEVIRKRDRSV